MSVNRNLAAGLATAVTCGVLLVGGGYFYKHMPASHRNDGPADHQPRARHSGSDGRSAPSVESLP
jgi:hypothetical protein